MSTLFPITKNNYIKFYKDGEIYFNKYIECIRNAQESIHLQTYIFENDQVGKYVKKELINASLKGVKVYLLIDSIGSRNLSLKTQQEFINAGIYFCRFNSIQMKWLYRWGRRLHHKILLIDYKEAIIGGINILDPCPLGSKTPQLDFAIYLKGPAIIELSHYCQKVFQKSYKNPKLTIKKIKNYEHFSNGFEIGISINDWIHGRSNITKQYSLRTAQAQKQITIINSYFFPRKKFMKQLTEAAARGVNVRLILPKYSDWPSYILASEYLYDYFLKRGVEIFQWKNSVLHGKLATVDHNWSTIGSFNLNYTSYQQNLEMNVDIYSSEFNGFLNKEINYIIASGCEKLDEKIFNEKCTLKIRTARFVFYLTLSVIANFSIGLSFQEDHNKEHRFYHILRILGSFLFFFMGIIGALLPIVPGFPFFIISFLLVYKQVLLNKKII